MKKITLTILAACFCMLPAFAADNKGSRFQQTEEAVKEAMYGHIDAKGLKNLIDSDTPFVLLDARGPKWNDNNIIQGAKLAWHEDNSFERIIPHKDSLIVIYCFSFTCPLSAKLADKLISLGYVNILEYPAGLKEWRDVAGYPIDILKK